MTLSVTPIRPDFGAEIAGVDLRRPLADADIAALRDALNRYAVLVFHDQAIDDAEQAAFSARFGPLERTLRTSLGSSRTISNLSNVDAEGRLFAPGDARSLFLAGNQRWHTDSSFKIVPAMASALSAREVPPEGGETEYADMRAAYDALDDARKAEIADLVAVHSYIYSQGQISLEAMAEAEKADLPPVEHPVVRHHPESGRDVLYIGRHASHVVGWPVERGRALLDDLLAHATQPRFVYRHRWRKHDLVMWDNRSVLHRGRPWDGTKYRRVMHRTTVAGAAENNPWLAESAAAE